MKFHLKVKYVAFGIAGKLETINNSCLDNADSLLSGTDVICLDDMVSLYIHYSIFIIPYPF